MTEAVGLMSGTSADGVSAALVSFRNRFFQLLRYRTFPYPQATRKKILNAEALSLKEIAQLDFELGRFFANVTLKFLRTEKINRRRIAVIGSHGQTIYHGPQDKPPCTFQIGEAAVICEQTGIPVVSDFRPQDLALGGEGAPLVPFFDHYFYGRGPLRVFQNIGGIANVTLVGRRLHAPIAFDTGPGNCLIDLAMQKITDAGATHASPLHFDRDGRWARQGKIQSSWLKPMMQHPYFRRRPPKSTGREEFGTPFLKKFLGRRLTTHPNDAIATLTYFTALTIYESVVGARRASPLREIVASGGGAKNPVLMAHLKELFSPIPVRSIEEFGIPAQAREPIAFAFLALRAIQGKINHLPSATGAKRATVLGKIVYPSISTHHPGPATVRGGLRMTDTRQCT